MEQQLGHYILFGFQVALQPINLLYCFLGVTIGTLIGILPGIGPAATIALMLPTTYTVSPVSAVIMLAGIYYGAMYGGSTTSILVNIPGEAASVVTVLDGYQMARQGRAGAALGISAFGSFIGGSITIVAMMLLAPPLANVALKFGPPEYFSLIILGFMLLTYLSAGSMIKALMMAAVGIIIASIGMDEITGACRFCYQIQALYEGVGLVPVIIGLFGVSEVFINLDEEVKQRSLVATKVKNLLPNREDWKKSIGPILRGSVIGFALGIIPGGGTIISSFAAYVVEKRLSKTPEKFGTGMIEGVAGPETANNAACSGSLIPLLTLGIPSNVVMLIIIGALMIHGVQPGPLLIKESPEIFWGVVTSMYLGNAMLLILNLPLIGLWVRILRVPYKILFPLILLFCLIGAFSTEGKTSDTLVVIIFGVVGYLLKKFDYEPAPLIFALVLGPMFENAFQQSLLMSNGKFGIFLTRPISAAFILVAAAMLIMALLTKSPPGKDLGKEKA